MPERTPDSYLNCFLCLHYVDKSCIKSYYIFQVNHETNHMECRTQLGHQTPSQYEATAPALDSPRTYVLHTRCRNLVGNLSQGMMGSLTDLVEPTFLDICSHPPPKSLNGGFYHAPPPLTTGRESSTYVKSLAVKALTFGPLHERWPPEIWQMILQYDIGRLLFIMRVAAQLEKSGLRPAFIPQSRFIITTLSLSSCVIRIHLATIGGRTYISRLSDPMATDSLSPPYYMWKPPSLPNKLMTEIKESLKVRYRDFIISDCRYLAVKSDGMGIVDIAFKRVNKRPHWILNMTTQPFVPEISEIRDADIQNLTVISDSLKCRAIVPSNRTGTEPFFYKRPFPPSDAWIGPAILGHHKCGASDRLLGATGRICISKAEYIPFSGISNIALEFQECSAEPSVPFVPKLKYMRSLFGIKTTTRPIESKDSRTSISILNFSRPPRSLKVVICRCAMDVKDHTFLQFDIEGTWQPPLLRNEYPVHERVVNNVLGIWCASLFANETLHVGIVTAEKQDPSTWSPLLDSVHHLVQIQGRT